MSIKLPNKKTLILSFLIASVLSWKLKYVFTPLLFHGITYSGQSVYIKFCLVLLITFIFAIILIYPVGFLNRPLDWLATNLKKKVPFANNDIFNLHFESKSIVYFFIVSCFFLAANLLMLYTNRSGFPRNGKLKNSDLPQLIQIACYAETENFVFGNYSNPLEMSLRISPEFVNNLQLDLDLIINRYKPFKQITIDKQYQISLSLSEFEDLQIRSKFITWRQINGNLYYYFLPNEIPMTYYLAQFGADYVFIPDYLINSN